jgi:hypothetical protein
MSFPSSKEIRENPDGKRMSEGWHECVSKSIKFREIRDKPTLIFEWENQNKETITDFNAADNAFALNRLKQLIEIANVEWGEDATGDQIADMLNASLLRVYLRVIYGKGDKSFVAEYTPVSDSTILNETLRKW